MKKEQKFKKNKYKLERQGYIIEDKELLEYIDKNLKINQISKIMR